MSDAPEAAPEATVREWMTTDQVADYINFPPETVRRWRKEGRGPKWSKPIHQVRYRRVDVDAWMQLGTDQPAVDRA